MLTAAQHIGKGNTNVPGFDIPNVEELLYGQTVTGEGGPLARQCSVNSDEKLRHICRGKCIKLSLRQ